MKQKLKKNPKETPKNEPKSMTLPMVQYSLLEFWGGFLAVFFLSLLLYYFTMYPGLPIGDSGEFMSTAIDFGVSHPPGYPLFTTLSYLFINILPFKSPAWRVNILSVLFGSAFNACIYSTVTILGGIPSIGFLSAGWIGFSRLLWMWSIQGEIFSLNNLFCCVLMLLAYRFEMAKDKLKEAKISALVCGLSLTNQHTSVLFIIPFAIRVAYTMIFIKKIPFNNIVTIILYGLLGMSWYLQMPISHYFFKPRVTWGEFNSVRNFLRHMLRLDYGSSFKLVAGESKSSFFANFVVFVRDSSRELSVVLWLLVIGLYAFTYKYISPEIKRSLNVISFMMIFYFAVFCSLANIDDLKGLNMGVLERFWMQPLVGLTVLAGISACFLIRYVSLHVNEGCINKSLWWIAAVLLVSFQIKRNYYENDESKNLYSYHYAMSVLPDLPQNSILLSGGDLPTNIFRYHTICEGIRPDVRVMDMQFMAAEWYKNVLAPTTFKGVNLPGVYRHFSNKKLQKGQYNIEIFLDLNIDKFPIFVCNGISNSDESHKMNFMAIPFRSCYQFKRRNKVKNIIAEVENSPGLVLYKWPMPNGFTYEDRTWEHTLLMTYINSLTKRGVFMWEEATLYKNNPQFQRLMLEHGLEYMSNATKQLEEAIAKNLIAESVWEITAETFAKNMGNYCMIMHSIIDSSNDSTKEDKLPQLELCVRKYWRLYMRWVPDHKKDPFIAEINNVLKRATLRGLKFNI